MSKDEAEKKLLSLAEAVSFALRGWSRNRNFSLLDSKRLHDLYTEADGVLFDLMQEEEA